MKFYFAGSIRGGREDAALYQQIIAFLQGFGVVLTEHIGDPNLTEAGDDGPTDQLIHNRDMEWLQQADLIVAEVTQVSMGVGYEIGRSVEMGKKVLCLHRPGSEKKLSAMISGCEKIDIVYYSEITELLSMIRSYLNKNFKVGNLNNSL